MKSKIAAILVLSAGLAGTALAFKADFFGGLSPGGNPVHEEITREALSDIQVFFDDGTSATLGKEFINALIEENTENDEMGLDDGRLHFDDSRLRESAKFVWNAKQAAVSGFFSGGVGGTLDGGVIQTNLGSAMHTIQDFFAHSTWTEINTSVHDRYGPLKGPLLPLPRIGLSETPFTEGIFTTITKLDVVLFAGTNEEVACNYSAPVSPALLLTSAYYDFQMSAMLNPSQGTIDHGFYTDGWVGLDSTQLTLGGMFRASTGLPIKWPKGRCVHGGDGPDAKGINKDKSDRPGYAEARKAAVQATRAFMLNFLASANVLANPNKDFVCKELFDCKVDVSNPSSFSVTKAESPNGFGDWSDKVLKITSSKKWPSRMLSYTLDGMPCDVYRPWRKDDNADDDHDTINCSSNKQGPLDLKIFQTARPQNVLQTLSYTVNEAPVAAVTDIQPRTAVLGVPTTFTITGVNLPNLPITLLGGRLCAAATKLSTTGYSVSCVAGGEPGNQQVIVRVDGGTSNIIDSSRFINVVASPPPPSPALSITFSAAAIGALETNAVSGNVSFVTGKDGRPAAQFGGVAAPGHIRIGNRAVIQFTDEATFDVWVRMDGLTGMDGYGRTVTDGAYAMAVVAKSHDRSGVALMANSLTRPDAGVWLASFDDRFGGNTCVHVPHAAVAVGTWARLTYVLSSSTGVQTYLNGQLSYSCPGARPDFTVMNGNDLYIGKYSDDWYPFNGAMQDLKIYKKALTAQQVAALP